MRTPLETADVDQTTRTLVEELRAEIDNLRRGGADAELKANIEFQSELFAMLAAENDRTAVWTDLTEALRKRRGS
jgi:hypothetical protein